jgi:YVTN family beta-propeller protein
VSATAISVIDTSKLSVAPNRIGIAGSRAALTADGRYLYTLSGKQFVAVDTDTFQVVRRLDVDWSGVVSMVVSADGFRVYSTDTYSDGIQVVDTAGNKLIGAIQVPGWCRIEKRWPSTPGSALPAVTSGRTTPSGGSANQSVG